MTMISVDDGEQDGQWSGWLHGSAANAVDKIGSQATGCGVWLQLKGAHCYVGLGLLEWKPL